MNDLERLQKLQSLLGDINRIITPDFRERMNQRIDNIEWESDYGNHLDIFVDDIYYWYAELNSLEKDLEDFPEDI